MMAELLKSTDGGRTFPALGPNPAFPPLTNGAQTFPLSPRVALLAAGVDGRLYRTTDGGTSWHVLPVR